MPVLTPCTSSLFCLFFADTCLLDPSQAPLLITPWTLTESNKDLDHGKTSSLALPSPSSWRSHFLEVPWVSLFIYRTSLCTNYSRGGGGGSDSAASYKTPLMVRECSLRLSQNITIYMRPMALGMSHQKSAADQSWTPASGSTLVTAVLA